LKLFLLFLSVRVNLRAIELVSTITRPLAFDQLIRLAICETGPKVELEQVRFPLKRQRTTPEKEMRQEFQAANRLNKKGSFIQAVNCGGCQSEDKSMDHSCSLDLQGERTDQL
jgi:hypothetical protein